MSIGISIRVENLTKVYRAGRPNEVRAVDGVSFWTAARELSRKE